MQLGLYRRRPYTLSISNDVRAIGVVTEGRLSLTFESHIAAVVKCCNMAAKNTATPTTGVAAILPRDAAMLARSWES